MDELRKALFSGDQETLVREVNGLLKAGTPAEKIMNEGLIASMAIIGERFKNNEIFIPEVLISADAMHSGMKILEPHLIEAGVKPVGKIVIGTVKGDLHDIGKNLVAMMLKGAGFQIEDCGIDCPTEKLIEALKKTGAQVLALSSLLTTSMSAMKDVIDALDTAGIRSNVKVMIGGAPITKGFADKIGADGYGKDAAEAVDIAKDLLGTGVV